MQYTTTRAVSQEQRRERAYETLLRDIAMSINNFKARCKMIGDTEASPEELEKAFEYVMEKERR